MKLVPALALALAALLALDTAALASAPTAVKASYNVYRDGLHVATVDETFERRGGKYQIVSASNPAGVLKRLFKTQVRIHSNGTVTPTGLKPEQFDYGRLDDPSKNVMAQFDWAAEQLRMAYDGRKESIALPAGTQDRLSLMYQFMFMPLAGSKLVSFPMTNGKKVESYRYQIAGSEALTTPLGTFQALRLIKQRDAGDNAVDVWLAPERGYMPVKVLIVENDGAKFEQVITRLEIKAD